MVSAGTRAILEFHTRVLWQIITQCRARTYILQERVQLIVKTLSRSSIWQKGQWINNFFRVLWLWLIFGSAHWEWKKLSLRRVEFLYLEVKVCFWRRDFLLDLAALLSSFSLSWAQKPWEKKKKKSWRYGICLVLVLSTWILCQKRCKLGRRFIQWLEADFKRT